MSLEHNKLEQKQIHTVVKIGTNVSRFVLAIVFIFSGFVKAVDPLGTMYKIEEYFEALGLTSLSHTVIPFVLSIGIALLEFCLGLYFFFGFRRRLSTMLSLIFLSVMTLLTFWLAIANPISDCGCFGDAIVLSNWQTFWKNVVLLLAAVVAFKWGNLIVPFVTKRFDWLVELYSILFIGGIIFFSLRDLPVFDFRPYHIGANIREKMSIPEGKEPTVLETYYMMEKDGKTKEFTADNYPDSTWTYVDSEVRVLKKGYEPPIRHFSISDMETGANLTDEILDHDGYVFLLVASQLADASEVSIDLINDLYDYCLEYKYPFYCLTASSEKDVAEWQERTGAEYPFASMDDVTLRTIVRSNPGLVLLKKGTVVNKWSVNNIPDEYQLTDRLENLPIGAFNRQNLFTRILKVLLWFVIPLAFFSMLDVGWEYYKQSKKEKL